MGWHMSYCLIPSFHVISVAFHSIPLPRFLFLFCRFYLFERLNMCVSFPRYHQLQFVVVIENKTVDLYRVSQIQ